MSGYKRRKIQILKQLGILLTDQEITVLVGLKTEIATDQWSRRIIMERLGEDIKS